MRLFVHHRQRNLTTSVMLAMLLFRAYVPLGFMPASGSPFLLEICPQGLSLQMPAHHVHVMAGHSHDSGSHTYFADCSFGSAPAAGPITHLIVFEPAEQITAQALPDPPLQWGVALKRAHRARAPPTPA
jgi:hypothetical protein